MDDRTFRRRFVIALVVAAVVLLGWTWFRTAGFSGERKGCEPGRNVERDAEGKVTAIRSTVCVDD